MRDAALWAAHHMMVLYVAGLAVAAAVWWATTT